MSNHENRQRSIEVVAERVLNSLIVAQALGVGSTDYIQHGPVIFAFTIAERFVEEADERLATAIERDAADRDRLLSSDFLNE